MRRKVLITLMLTLLAGGTSSVQADNAAAPGSDRRPDANAPVRMEPGDCGCREHGPFGLPKQLELSAAQKARIKEIVQAEREKSEPLREKLAEARKQLWQAETSDKFDETAVRKIAAEQARLMTDLTVARARVHGSIHALLTPEQKKAVGKLPPPWEKRRGDFPPRGDHGDHHAPPPPPEFCPDAMPRDDLPM